MRDWVTATIGVGANLGDARDSVRRAMTDIGALAQVRTTHQSALYASAPIDSSGPDYINAVVAVQTLLTAPQLLVQLQSIETQAGRERPYRNAPRTLDLDLLLYGQACIQSPALTVPHPRMWERAFVVLPLAEIAPDRVSADALARVDGQTIQRLE